MKLFAYALIAAIPFAGVATAASAASLTIDSNSSTVSYAGFLAPGAPTSSLVYSPSGTFNIGTGGGTWTNPIGGSSWVSLNPNTYPGGSVVENPGTYVYYSLFTDSTPGTSSGTITVMADDTTSVYLNNVLIAPDAAQVGADKCTVAAPNCVTPITYTLTGFVSGTNYLAFGVDQYFGSATGLDFEAKINTTAATPEPGSLFLLATGLVGTGGMIRRRAAARLAA